MSDETRTIRKAVIPLAGLATRMRPISQVVPKALLPLVGPDGRVRPIVHFICTEAMSGGVDEIALIVTPGHEQILRDYFAAAGDAGDKDVPEKIVYIPAEPKGFGYAIAQAEDFVAGQPVMILLGDHVHRPACPGQTCAAQVASAYRQYGGKAVVGMHVVGPDELPRMGVAAGQPLDEGVYRCTHFVEKPDLSAARESLRTPGLDKDRFLAHAGIYAFAPEIFNALNIAAEATPTGGEVEMAAAQSLLLRQYADEYFLVQFDGQVLDTGTPTTYAEALRLFPNG